MKKVKVAVIVSMLLIGLVLEVQPFVSANPVTPHPFQPFIIFYSPQNKSYNTNALVLNVSVGTITLGQCPGENYEATYSLDGQEFVSIPLVFKGIFSDNSMPHSLYIGAINLPSLSEGNHSIAVHCLFEIEDRNRYVNYSLTGDNLVIFTIDKLPPHIFVQTVENKTYETSDLPLNFTINEFTSKLTYSLDGQENITITGNTTL
jgi:hypothetical protein